MLRRPPGEGRHVANHKKLLAFAALLLPWLPLAEQHHQQSDYPIDPPIIAGRIDRDNGDPAKFRQESPLEGGRVNRNLAATALTKEVLETPHADLRRKSTHTSIHNPNAAAIIRGEKSDQKRHIYDHLLIPDDASAVATLAPEQSVRAPSPHSRRSLSPTAGDGAALSTPHLARDLEDWEVEDFVLLATVDGDLFASDRKTGEVLWRQEVEQPMIETKHHRINITTEDEDYLAVDHYIWAIEPNKDGALYLWTPESGNGFAKLDVTMKKLVEELSPYAASYGNGEPAIVYTGDKKTQMITLDAETGNMIKFFGPSGSGVNSQDSCLRPHDVPDIGVEECRRRGTITLGRVEYTVGIQRRDDSRAVATLKYSEWSPNNFDGDLLKQYSSTMDSQYITSQPDGRVYGLDYRRPADGPLFTENFPTPVARVFDVARPWRARDGGNTELVVLPQPPPPAENADDAFQRSTSIFLNQTETGSWYIMSARAYPLVLDAPLARISQRDWWATQQSMNPMDSRALVGTHSLNNAVQVHISTLPGPVSSGSDDFENGSVLPSLPTPSPEPSTIIDKVNRIPHVAANRVYDFLANPVLWSVLVTALFWSGRWKDLPRRLRRLRYSSDKWFYLDPDVSLDETPEPLVVGNDVPQAEKPVSADDLFSAADGTVLLPPVEGSPETDASPEICVIKPPLGVGEPQMAELVVEAPVEEKKRKAHRGRRGGRKHKKNRNDIEEPVSRDDDPTMDSVGEVVDKAKKIGVPVPGFEPDLQTLPNGVEEVSNPIHILDDGLEVHEDKQLGTGSNGTAVYAGTWQGRAIAVKRILRNFYDIASQETRLLRESDDHPNVIRYYVQQTRGDFIYIGLELCQASLAEVVEKPNQFLDLAIAGQQNMPEVLYQITNGLCHLHNLRIVHRDLKPQNILVTMDKNGRPRVMVSDFGLCKKLEGKQSSFRATTAHAAGTSGWRAPELLLDDDVPDNGTMLVNADSSTHSGNGSIAIVSPEMHGRRATRSIDIFSLGLVFYYVLTQGSHPFDCGDRYMREVNIRKGNYNLSKLEVLGEYQYEAKHLIDTMIRASPKERPHAVDVMAHPFFWTAKTRLNFLCDVSDHFEKEVRDPPSTALQELESRAPDVTGGDFLSRLPKSFVDSLGKQRKYTGSRLLDLLRALRNKKNHYEDMPDQLKKSVGPLPEGYLAFWTTKYSNLLLTCWEVVYQLGWEETDRFKEYYEPAGLQ